MASSSPSNNNLRHAERAVSALKGRRQIKSTFSDSMQRSLYGFVAKVADVTTLPDSFWEGKTRADFFTTLKTLLDEEEAALASIRRDYLGYSPDVEKLRACAISSRSSPAPVLSEAEMNTLVADTKQSALYVARIQATLETLRNQLVNSSASLQRFAQ